MPTANVMSIDLSDDDQRRLEWLLVEFDQAWQEGRLAEKVHQLPPPGDSYRSRALAELVKIDLERQWERGRRVTVEMYLSTYPELGTPDTVPADLIQAEYEVRRQFGGPVDLAELAQRFPRQAVELRRLIERAREVVPDTELSGSDTLSLQDGVTPPPARPSVHDSPTQPPSAAASDSDRPARSPAGASWSTGELPEKFGRYRILKCLGQGGMGAVYLAHDTQLDRQVAMKVPHFAPDAGPDVLERFYRESRAAATLDHPNICPVYDVGELDGVHYLVMAYIEGKPLSEFVSKDKPIPQRQVAAIIRKLALALQEANARGVVHRDLKPANIMVNKRRELVVMDFGLARLMKKSGDSEHRLTQSGVIMGTPSYMSPEQVMGDVKAMGPPCDIYSLGVIMYELLTGRLPFQGTLTAVLAQIVVDQPQPPSKHRADTDRQLEAICLKAMAKKIEQRYRSMDELAKALSDYLAGRSAAAESVTDRGAPPTPPPAKDRSPIVVAENVRGTLAPHTPAAGDAKIGTPGPVSRRPIQPRDKGRPAKQPVSGPAVSQRAVSQIADENLEQFFAAAAAEQEPPTARSKTRAGARSPSRFSRWSWLAAAAAALLLFAAIIYIATNNGTIKIEVNDPDVVVRVDGNVVTIERLGEPITLRAGEHELVVKRGDIEVETRSFLVRRGENPALRVTLQEKQQSSAGDPLGDPPAGPSSRDNFGLQLSDVEISAEFPTLSYDGQTALTIEAWAVPDEEGPGVYLSGTPSLRLTWNDQMWRFSRVMGETGVGISSRQVPPLKLTHVAAVRDGDDLSLYIDGRKAAGERFRSTNPRLAKAPSHLGGVLARREASTKRYLKGRIAELRISRSVRYGGDFTPAPRFEPDEHTLALYHFDEGTGAVLNDASGNGHHGKIISATWVPLQRTAKGHEVPDLSRPRTIETGVAGSRQTGEWVSLFNGRDLTGWHVMGPAGWTVADQAIKADGSGGGWLATERDYTDFELELEYRLSAGGNSGVFLRAWPEGPLNGGQFLEIQLLDDDAPSNANVSAERRNGSIYGSSAPNPLPIAAAGNWSTLHVRAEGRRVQVWLNARQIQDVNLDNFAQNFDRFPGLKRNSGRIGLQMHRTPAEFRNIRVRDLAATARDESRGVPLFKGPDLAGWSGNFDYWKAHDGVPSKKTSLPCARSVRAVSRKAHERRVLDPPSWLERQNRL